MLKVFTKPIDEPILVLYSDRDTLPLGLRSDLVVRPLHSGRIPAWEFEQGRAFV